MRALVAMSGGVDSSVCAYLTQRLGYECIGVTMKLCKKDLTSTDAMDAFNVCQKLGMEHITIDCTKQFKDVVIDNFTNSYENGATPNPCIVCNRHLKFGLLMDKAKELGCDILVTGHYARIQDGKLLKAKDTKKDQSYVLYPIDKDKLTKIYFPLGDYTKDEVRAIADREGFVTARKSDSQDICFVPDGDYASVISEYTDRDYPEGNFVDVSGNVLGLHKGIIRYTVGQRKGLGIAFGKPMYVKDKNIETNEVILCSNEELFSSECTASDFNTLVSFEDGASLKAKVRYNQTEQSATIYRIAPDRVKAVFDSPQRAIAKGQSLVVYDGDIVVGGGIIE